MIALRINPETYGYFNEDTGIFTCSHGGWDASCELLSDTRCRMLGRELDYIIVENIPEDYIR